MANYDDDYNDDQPRRSSVVERAKAKVHLPAILLIIVGVISLCSVGYGAATFGQFDENLRMQIQTVENNAQLPADQKKMQIDLMKQIGETLKPMLMPVYIIAGLVAILTIFGGIKFMSLGGKGIVIAGSILSMIPITSGCCCIGLPVGIWVLIAINNQVVRDGYAALARRANSRYEE